MKLYRYEIEYRTVDNETDVTLTEIPVVRETQACYFLDSEYFHPRKAKRVLKDAMNTYAYDTKEKAKEHFIRRTKTRIRWFKFWLDECEKGLELIKEVEI